MGLWEYIKKSLNLGADDMTMVHEVPMDSFRATDTTHTMRSGKYWPFKKMFMSADGRMPNGFALEPNGKITNPHVYDSVMGDAIRTMPMMKGSAGGTLWSALEVISRLHPENTVGSGFHDVGLGAPANPDEWKWGHVTRVANGADVEIIATKAGVKFQVVVTKITVTPISVAATWQVCAISLQDSDNVNLSGTYQYNLPFFFDAGLGATWPGELTFPWMGAVAYSATANRAIEMDVTGLTGNDIVDIYFAWREFA